MRQRRGGRAFTLVELLIVIGIIALLIALLLPAILRVRTQAQIVACLSNQREMFLAASLCLIDHKGFVPQTGTSPLLADIVGGPGKVPDMERIQRRWTCYPGKTGQLLPAPMTSVMAYYMGMTTSIGTREEIEAVFTMQSYRKVFQCPADDDPPAHWTMLWQHFEDDSILEPTSYGFNDYLSNGCFTKVYRPHEIAFFMDVNATKERNRNQDFCRHWQGASFFDVWDNKLILEAVRLRPGEPW